MKKIITIFLFIFTSILSFTSSGYIASFNTLRLGKNKKDYNYLAKAIKPFDIVGLIEVMNVKGIERLTDELNKISDAKWDYIISPYSVGTDNYKEYYGYVYKKNKVKHINNIGFYPDTNNDFIREPFAANFKIDSFDFTFVLAHSIYGKKISQRQFEANEMINVYKYFQNLDLKENDIIIAGDFNLPANNSSFFNLVDYKDNLTYVIDPSIKTTIGSKGLANSYDNMFISKKYTTEFQGQSGALDITLGDYIKTRKEVSDHLPIFILVNTEKDDD